MNGLILIFGRVSEKQSVRFPGDQKMSRQMFVLSERFYSYPMQSVVRLFGKVRLRQ